MYLLLAAWNSNYQSFRRYLTYFSLKSFSISIWIWQPKLETPLKDDYKTKCLKKIPLFWSPCMLSNETEDGTQYFYQVEQLTFLWILLTLIVIGNATVLIALLLSKAYIFAFLLLFQPYREINRCFNIFMNLCFYRIYFLFTTYFVYNNVLQRS